MNEIQKVGILDASLLSENDYFSSLIEAAYTKGLLSDGELERIQIGLISIVKRQIDKYTNGDSASVRTEIAQSLAESAVYTLGVITKTFAPDDAIDSIKVHGVERLFFEGQKKINRKVTVLRSSTAVLKKRLVKTNSVCYNELPACFEEFLKEYDPEFEAHGVFDTVYPSFLSIKNLSGIEFAEKYMAYISYENAFLKFFDVSDIDTLLKKYDRSYMLDPINIFEPVFSNSIARAVTGHSDGGIFIDSEDRSLLYELLSGKTQDEVFSVLSGALANLMTTYTIEHTSGLMKYLLSSCDVLAGTVFEAAKRNKLDSVFC